MTEAADRPATAGIDVRKERQTGRRFFPRAVLQSVNGVHTDAPGGAEGVSAIGKATAMLPDPALGRELRQEQLRQARWIAVDARGVVGDRHERATHAPTSRSRKGKIEGVEIVRVLGPGLGRRYRERSPDERN